MTTSIARLGIMLSVAWVLAAGPAIAQEFPDENAPPALKKSAAGADRGPPGKSPDPIAPPKLAARPESPAMPVAPATRDDSPESLLKAMQESLQVVADEGDPAEVRAAFRKAFDVILGAAEKVLRHPKATEAQKNEAYQYQASVLYQGARRGELGYADRLEQLAETLYRANRRSDVANLTNFLCVKARYEEDEGLRADALPAVQEYLKKYPREEAAVELLLDVAHAAEAAGRSAVAKDALELVAKTFKRHETAARIPAALQRLDLVGKKLNLELSLTDGKKFVFDGPGRRVVVVQFWATWCQGCTVDQDILRDLYGRYRDDGLEVVGIPLDESEPAVKQYLLKNKLTWPQALIPPDPKDQRLNHPVARQYGLMQIPTNFLIAEGKVVATQVRGQTLRRKVEDLMTKRPPAAVTGLGELDPLK